MPLRLAWAWQHLGKAGQISSRVANRKTQQGLGVAEVSDGKIMRSAGVMHCEISRGITSAAHPAWPRLVGRGEKSTLALLQRRTEFGCDFACGSGFGKCDFPWAIPIVSYRTVIFARFAVSLRAGLSGVGRSGRPPRLDPGPDSVD